tara:strand:- start:42 stop:569 length:528 start_codon:yes stop_codon:yes gene_type:complete
MTLKTAHKIIDDWLPPDTFKSIQDQIVFNPTYPMFLTQGVSHEPGTGERTLTDLNNWSGGYTLYLDHMPSSPLFEDLAQKTFRYFPFMHSLIRARVNFYPRTSEVYEHEPHQDYPFSHNGAVFHLNTNDGYTKLEDGTKVESIENRLVMFDASVWHQSTTTSDQCGRYNIQFNYF